MAERKEDESPRTAKERSKEQEHPSRPSRITHGVKKALGVKKSAELFLTEGFTTNDFLAKFFNSPLLLTTAI